MDLNEAENITETVADTPEASADSVNDTHPLDLDFVEDVSSSNLNEDNDRVRPYKGTLLWFNKENKFGFIECDDDYDCNDGKGSGDLFVYESDTANETYASFLRVAGSKKRRASTSLISRLDGDRGSHRT